MIVDSINKYLNHSGNTVLQAVEIAAVNMTDKISKTCLLLLGTLDT